jgi:hypothetical protein
MIMFEQLQLDQEARRAMKKLRQLFLIFAFLNAVISNGTKGVTEMNCIGNARYALICNIYKNNIKLDQEGCLG